MPLLGIAQQVQQKAPLAEATGKVVYDLERDIFHPVHMVNGMVATENSRASEIGMRVLRSGGNAVDAGVAIAFALAVTLPNAGNLGGGGFMLLHEAKSGRDVAIDFRETAPAAARKDSFLDTQGHVIVDKSLFTHAAVGVPGTVAGMMYALERYGSQSRQALIAPAIELADKGYPIDEQLASLLKSEREHLDKWESTKNIFFHEGRPLRAGELLRQLDLAKSLRLISRDGASAFYGGPLGDAVVAESNAHGGLMTAADLKHYKVVEREPVRGMYRGYEVVSMPPPSSGGVHIIEILNMLANYPLRAWGHNSAKTIHVMAEAMKLAYADRAEFLGDPDFVKVPVAGLISVAYARARSAAIDLTHATPSSQIRAGQPDGVSESDQTTHFSVADRAGNVVSMTYTLNTNFGSGIVAAGTGFFLNNEMDDFSVKPGVPNAYGLVGGQANGIDGRKRPLSSMSPTFVLKDHKPWLVTGSPGGARIITTTLQSLINMIDFDMNPAAAISAVRVHHQWLPDELRIERGLSVDTISLLQGLGHRIVERPTMGRAQIIQITSEGFFGYSDPRNPNGAAIGF